MRIERKAPARSYYDRGLQLRMLGMVMALGFVIFAIRETGRPEFWRGLFPEEEVAEDADEDDAVGDGDSVGVSGGGEDTEPGSHGEPAAAGDETRDPVAELPARGRVDPTFDAEFMADVEDDTPGIRRAEADPYYRTLAMLDHAVLADVERMADESPTSTVLMHNPDYFRGRVVTITGDLKRLKRLSVPPRMQERYGVDELWDAWIAMPDAPRNPLHVYFTDVPEGLPSGQNIDRRVDVRVAAYFFKREAFEGPNGVTRTPMLLGKQPRYLPFRPVVGEVDDLTPYVIGFASVVAVTLGLLLWWYSRADRRFGDAHVKAFVAAPEGAIESLKDVETVEPLDTLRQLAEEDRAADTE